MAEAAREIRPILPMPIRATPYRHQIEAFNFVCALFGLVEGGERDEAGDSDVRPVRAELRETGPEGSGA